MSIKISEKSTGKVIFSSELESEDIWKIANEIWVKLTPDEFIFARTVKNITLPSIEDWLTRNPIKIYKEKE